MAFPTPLAIDFCQLPEPAEPPKNHYIYQQDEDRLSSYLLVLSTLGRLMFGLELVGTSHFSFT